MSALSDGDSCAAAVLDAETVGARRYRNLLSIMMRRDIRRMKT